MKVEEIAMIEIIPELRKFGLLLAFAGAVLSIACSSNRTLVVLLPDNDGKVGQIEIQSQSGTHFIREAYRGSKIDGTSSAEFDEFGPSDVQQRFEKALSAQPDSKYRFWTGKVFFKWDSDELVEESKAAMPSLAKIIKGLNPTEIYLVGHTDIVGTEDYNLELSRRRAAAVKNTISSIGIKKPIFLIAYGKKKPLVTVPGSASHQLNRRVEIIIKYEPVR